MVLFLGVMNMIIIAAIQTDRMVVFIVASVTRKDISANRLSLQERCIFKYRKNPYLSYNFND
jgi:hypothetical protein